MLLKRLLITFSSLIPFLLSAQTDSNNTQQSIVRIGPGQTTSTFDLTERFTVIHLFYNDDWRKGKLINMDGAVQEKEFPMMYDMLNQELTVSISGKVYAVPTNKIKGFVFTDENNEEGYAEKFLFETPQKGKTGSAFFELIEDGKYKLLTHHTFFRQKANYVAALDNGDKESKIYKRAYPYLQDENGIYRIPKKKKAAIKFFQQYPSAKIYLKKNKVNFKNQEDLIDLIKFMNE